MELIINKEACNGCQMKCNSSPNCCCDCKKNCSGRLVCPIFNYSPEVKKRKERMTREKMYKNMFAAKINE
jgi:predicted amidophosphoribosyltransferase